MRDAISRLDVDGVPLFVAPGDGVPRVALSFRVGMADEPLPVRGITHLVEHLTLSTVGDQPFPYNGFVDGLRTVFHATGTPAQLVSFLGTACRALRSLPVDRLDAERRILSSESAGHGSSAVAAAHVLRWGATGHGRCGFDELGLRWLPEENIAAWAARWFTAGNAAMWWWGDVPDDLSTVLPPGRGDRTPRSPLDDAVPVELDPPTWIPQSTAGVAVSMLASRSVSLATAVRIAERRARGVLRRDAGVSYTVASSYEVVGPDTGHVFLWADAHEERGDEVASGLVDVVERLAVDGATDEELGFEREVRATARAHPESVLGELDAAVLDTLLGRPALVDDVDAQAEALTGADVAMAFAEARRSAIVAVPFDVELEVDGYRRAPEWSSSAVVGATFVPVHQPGEQWPPQRRLVLAGDGISLDFGEGRVVTGRFSESEALGWCDDGQRALFVRDGFVVRVRPWEWVGGNDVVAALDRGMAGRAVPLGPGSGPPAPLVARAAANRRSNRRVFVWLGVLGGPILAVLGLAFLFAPPSDGSGQDMPCGDASSWAIVTNGSPPGLEPSQAEACRAQADDDVSTGAGMIGVGAVVGGACGVLFLRERRRGNA